MDTKFEISTYYKENMVTDKSLELLHSFYIKDGDVNSEHIGQQYYHSGGLPKLCPHCKT